MSTAEDPHENTPSVAMKIVTAVFGGFITLSSILVTIALYGLSVLLLMGAIQLLWNLVAGNGKPVDGAVACLMLLLCGFFVYLVRKSADHYVRYLRGSNQAPEDETDPEMPDADAAEFDLGEELEMYGFTIFSAPLEELTEEVKKSHDHQSIVELSLNLENYPVSSAALVALGDPEVVEVPLPDDTLKNTLDSDELPDQWNLFAARVLMLRDPSVTLETAIREYPWVDNPQWTQLILDNRDHLLNKSPFAEELPKLVDLCKGSTDPNESVSILSAILNAEEVETLREELRMSELEGIFEVWPEKSAEEKAELRQSSLISTQKDHLHSSVERFSLDHPRSLLITGPSGVGKKTIALSVLCQLEDQGWTVLESSAQDLIAGMMFIGQMEERWVKILPELQKPKTILYIPDFSEMEHAGKHMQNPIGLLDRLNNEVRRQRITVLGVLSENDMEGMLRSNSALRKYYDVESISSPAASAAEEILLHEAQRLEGESGISTPAAVAKLMVELSGQFLSFQAPLGGAFDLLKSLVQRKSTNKAANEKIMLTPEDVFEEITRLSGLPTVLVDPNESLDPNEVQTFFRNHLIGQEEAIQCMVDRITLLKAGLTDTDRPLGVFFFAGPTGTGKTESAKVLARYLFGSKDRLLRVDMSELQSYEDLSKLFGSGTGLQNHHQRSLLDSIRNQPFSVVLLDEFEKAHPNVWDLFLQAFDDARMTDAAGHVVSLKHVVFILTSNVGAREASQGSFGFKSSGGADNPYEIALRETFRPEFLNRIDQIVTFRPFSRTEQRALLELELERVLSRRGLKDRPWAVEWEDSAIDLLLTQGLTADLGARPLRRAVEQHALTPIAREMLAHDDPQADQFLFVRGEGGKIVVDFVDPDATEQAVAEQQLVPIPELGDSSDSSPRLLIPYIAMRGSGRLEEVDALAEQVDKLESLVESAKWSEARAKAMESMGVAGFWDDPQRLPVLARAELRDRIDHGTETARSLLDRLSGDAETSRDSYPPALIQRLAQQIYLLDHAVEVLDEDLPQDAYLRIQPVQRDRESQEEQVVWSSRLKKMIVDWADKRNMQLEELTHTPDGEWIVAVTGFASWRFLHPLGGLHELENPEAQHKDRKIHARISIAPQPLGLPPGDRNERIRHAQKLLEDSPRKDEIVQRYRLNPDPKLVNLVQGWRFTQPEEALDGNFDLVASWASTRHTSESR